VNGASWKPIRELGLALKTSRLLIVQFSIHNVNPKNQDINLRVSGVGFSALCGSGKREIEAET
jgi:hypothetical protein